MLIVITFQRTTDPPVLASAHPLRKAFYHHGQTVARHWLHWILASSAIAVLLCYPVFFLYENPTTGFSKLPYHVWTSAHRFAGDRHTRVDVEIRQVWVHGSYMRALDRHVLEEALEIQRVVLGEANGRQGLGATNNAAEGLDKSWGVHSPLIFWNCSGEGIKNDGDILRTINEQAHRRTGLNLTLRPSSVFAGKTFGHNQLTAADALVITLFEKSQNGRGRAWNEKFMTLAQSVPDRWSIYPETGKVTQSQLYQFQFKPMSFRDDFFLFGAYVMMFAYVAVSLSKLRAVRSKFGLIVTVIMEMVFSIVGSFTICGLLGLDLARVPQEVYPFVVLVIGLENRFRLINAVLTTPQAPIVHRIANALGDVGHLSLAAAGQNLFLLWLATKFVSPGVASFCIFAGIALVFDFLFHLSFFIAVLSVDVRRMDLQESLDHGNGEKEHSKAPKFSERFPWLEALWQGRLPITSRIAGTAVSISFVLALNMHFENESMFSLLANALKALVVGQEQIPETNSYELPPINQARTPVAWLRIQDYESAKEVIEFVKPGAHSLLARIYDPLTIVLHGSDRGGSGDSSPALLKFAKLVERHLYPLLLVLILAAGFVTLLLQYLLWNEVTEDAGEAPLYDEPVMLTRTLPKVHRLDIVQLAACPKGHLVAVGLDRSISIAQADLVSNTYSLNVLYGASMTPPLWPVNVLTIDDSGTWAALMADRGPIAFWNLPERRLSHLARVDLDGELPVVFSMISIQVEDKDRLRLLIITQDCMVREIDVISSTAVPAFKLSNSRTTKAVVTRSKTGRRIFCATRTDELVVAHHKSGTWDIQTLSKRPSVTTPLHSKSDRIKSLVSAPPLCLLAVVRAKTVELLNIRTYKTIHTLHMPSVKGSTFRMVSTNRRECPTCHGAAVAGISFAYTHSEDGFCWFRTWRISSADETNPQLICLARDAESCTGPDKASERIRRVKEPGVWESTNAGSIIGIHKRPNQSDETPLSNASGTDAGYFNLGVAKHRRLPSGSRKLDPALDGGNGGDALDWEAWSLSSNGEFLTEPLVRTLQEKQHSLGYQLDDENDLFVVGPGPIARIGKRSVAIGFGNAVKVISLGHERFEDDADEFQDLALVGSVRRRRPGAKARAA
jgi:Sterol-sensing domain of SREBP cleavage-activation